jgi:hypothetical protein
VSLPLLLTISPLSLILTQPLTLVRPASLSFSLVGSVQGLFSCFFLSLRYSSGFTRGGLVTHNLSWLPGLAFFGNQLAYGRLVIRGAVEMATLGS